MTRKIGLIFVVIVVHHNMLHLSCVYTHTHSWDTSDKMVWYRRRLQCARHGVTGAQFGRFIQLLWPKVQPQDSPVIGRPAGKQIDVFSFLSDNRVC